MGIVILAGLIAGWLFQTRRRNKTSRPTTPPPLTLSERLQAVFRQTPSRRDEDQRVVDLLQTESHIDSTRSRRSVESSWQARKPRACRGERRDPLLIAIRLVVATPFPPAPSTTSRHPATQTNHTSSHGRSTSIDYGNKPDQDPFADPGLHQRNAPPIVDEMRSLWLPDDDASTVAYTDIGAYGSEINGRDTDHGHDTKRTLSRLSTGSFDVEMTAQAEDAGRLMAADDMREVVPPRYDPAWRDDRQ